jgi:hypothetical protein
MKELSELLYEHAYIPIDSWRALMAFVAPWGSLGIPGIPRSPMGLMEGAASWLPPSDVSSAGASADLPTPGSPYLLARYGKALNIKS